MKQKLIKVLRYSVYFLNKYLAFFAMPFLLYFPFLSGIPDDIPSDFIYAIYIVVNFIFLLWCLIFGFDFVSNIEFNPVSEKEESNNIK